MLSKIELGGLTVFGVFLWLMLKSMKFVKLFLLLTKINSFVWRKFKGA